MNKRMSNNFSFAISYTWSHSIDNGPNPSFVLIPQDSANFHAERASSACSAAQSILAIRGRKVRRQVCKQTAQLEATFTAPRLPIIQLPSGRLPERSIER